MVLAAGASSRMGADKALLELPGSGRSFVVAQVRSLAPFCERVIVVSGGNHERMAWLVEEVGGVVVQNPQPERGQFSSLRVGLDGLKRGGGTSAIVTHVDRVLPATATMEALTQAFARRGKDVWLVVPEHHGEHGHPVIASREMIDAWLAAREDGTARDVEHAHQKHVQYVEVDDASVLANVNTPEEYERLRSKK